MTFKTFLTLISCLCLTVLFASNDIPEELHYHVTRHEHAYSTSFELTRRSMPAGSIVRSVFHLNTHYDVYDRYQLYEGQGVCRFFCLGLFYDWGTEIDVYNDQGTYVGLIDGNVFSSQPAQFTFYHADQTRAAIAYLDQHCLGFTIVDPIDTNVVLARLTRHYMEGEVDYWDVIIYDVDRIPQALVKVFAAFACDSQDNFKKLHN